MLVRVLRKRAVPRGTVDIKDTYTGEAITQITVVFNPRDLKRCVVKEFATLLTVQAKRWMERVAAPAAEWHPMDVFAVIRDDLPDGLRCMVDEDDDGTFYVFEEGVITEGGAAAFARSIGARALTWVRLAG
jgi:hypothetical protein